MAVLSQAQQVLVDEYVLKPKQSRHQILNSPVPS